MGIFDSEDEELDAKDELSNFFKAPTAAPTQKPVAGPAAPAAAPSAPAAPQPGVIRTNGAPAASPATPVAQSYGTAGAVRTQQASLSGIGEITIDDLLEKLLEHKSSDLHLTHGEPPMMRKNGDIQPIPGFAPLSSAQIMRMMFSIMSPDQQTTYQREHDIDLAYAIPGKSRFRVNVLQQRGKAGAVIRVIPNEIKTLEQLGMPSHLAEFAKLPRGLVLVTGPTGSGKSTTLAAIIDAANRMRHDHILTIEDPIEFVHENKKCIVTQREVTVDTASFAEGLRRALREDPDIILVGEMRDPETTSIAITAAETGHLVFGTLHTQSAAETMSRIIDQFPDGSKEQVRAQLASTIQGIVCQTLVKTLDGRGRVAAMEILKGEGSIRSLIRKGQTEQIRSLLETNRAKGMQTLDMNLIELAKADKIAVDEAAARSTNAEEFYRQLGGQGEVERIRRRQQQLGGGGASPYAVG
jgi:twitching motility protein PilT